VKTAITVLLAVAFGSLAGTGSTHEQTRAIAVVVRHGGLCPSGTECRAELRISDTTISSAGYVTQRLRPGERAALLQAVRALDLPSLRAHPFTGTCPTAYDGDASIYRFRGLPEPLASCTYDLRGVRAVRLTERLLARLRPR
jgi:hypothetical protein